MRSHCVYKLSLKSGVGGECSRVRFSKLQKIFRAREEFFTSVFLRRRNGSSFLGKLAQCISPFYSVLSKNILLNIRYRIFGNELRARKQFFGPKTFSEILTNAHLLPGRWCGT